MDQWQRRTLAYLSSLTLLVVVYALAYDYGMTVYEGRPQPFYQSLQVVVETFTTTGYGSDAPWETPEMNFFVILMDATGVVLIFMALPVFVVPLFEQAVSTTLPTTVDMENHVVICTYSPRTETLISELSSWEMEYVIVEPDREQAMELYESDYSVVHGDPESVDSLANVNVEAAAAVVADASDEVDVSVVLTAREAASEVPVVSVVEEPELATYHELAGVDRVLSPRKLVGESLAGKVKTAVSAELGEAVEIGEDFEVAELPVQRGSHLVGSTLAESGIRERAGANVLGAWFRGEFETPLTPGTTLDAGTVLLVAGRESQLERLKELTRSPVRSPRGGRVVVVGHGEVGSTVTDELAAASVPYTVVDIADKPGVDVVGDTTDPETLEEAGIETARSVLFTLADDTVTSFGTLVARDLNPNVEILARAEETESVQKIYRAGADYVLALSTVSGRMLASTILEDEEVISMDKQVELVRTSAPRFSGQTLAEADIRSKTGCTVVAVERDGEVITDLGPEFRLQRDDDLIIAGDDEGVTEFTKVAN
ncbi:potassium channel family protein [Halorussus halophilus]|uniref:potassium channel family protein n=1 Tax=Halorussus halophilus TaxID=2650975 RepID=UPI0013018704|nr:NAD-binding protein [Halorussus halophilus]